MKEIPVGPPEYGYVAKVDDKDYEFLSQFNWSLIEWRGKQYAKRKQRLSNDPYPEYGTISMHSLILKGCIEVDHIDGDGLNNQRSNLREVTHAQNIQGQRVQRRSKSGYRGVSLFQPGIRKKPWRARIKVNGFDRTIDYFSSPEEAARAWNEEALGAWGEHAFLNEISEERR